MARKHYDSEFKIKAIKLVLEDNIPVLDVSEKLSIHYNTLYNWINKYKQYGENSFSSNENKLNSYKCEIEKLKEENLKLKEELDLLKKYQAFLKEKNI